MSSVKSEVKKSSSLVVLAIDSTLGRQATDWHKLFKVQQLNRNAGCIGVVSSSNLNHPKPKKDAKVAGRPVKVIQCGWDDFNVSSENSVKGTPSSRCLVMVKPRRIQSTVFGVASISAEERGGIRYAPMLSSETVKPDIVRAATFDFRNNLYGLMFAGVPGVNSPKAIFNFSEKAVLQVRSLMSMSKHYCTAEPFVQGNYDIRIQKIGKHYRAFKRIGISGKWKTQTGSSKHEILEVTDKYKFWADEAAKLFGGVDILTVDAIHNAADGKEYILEVNGTASGLLGQFREEDNAHIRDVVLHKLENLT
eukprot:jgi/Bigna1/136300/aug1.33_g11008